jgi:hypothetical protein
MISVRCDLVSCSARRESGRGSPGSFCVRPPPARRACGIAGRRTPSASRRRTTRSLPGRGSRRPDRSPRSWRRPSRCAAGVRWSGTESPPARYRSARGAAAPPCRRGGEITRDRGQHQVEEALGARMVPRTSRGNNRYGVYCSVPVVVSVSNHEQGRMTTGDGGNDAEEDRFHSRSGPGSHQGGSHVRLVSRRQRAGTRDQANRARVAELADAPDLGSGSRKAMGVRVPPFAPARLPCYPTLPFTAICRTHDHAAIAACAALHAADSAHAWCILGPHLV